MDAQVIYHLTTVEEWEDAQDKGIYEPPSYQREGFIHCCTDEQLEGVLQRSFQQHENLVKLFIDPTQLSAELKYDRDEEIQQEFPHIYGPLNLGSVVRIEFLDPITSDKEEINNSK
jgi:uncharacterized protein (DUF952 family)